MRGRVSWGLFRRDCERYVMNSILGFPLTCLLGVDFSGLCSYLDWRMAPAMLHIMGGGQKLCECDGKRLGYCSIHVILIFGLHFFILELQSELLMSVRL